MSSRESGVQDRHQDPDDVCESLAYKWYLKSFGQMRSQWGAAGKREEKKS